MRYVDCASLRAVAKRAARQPLRGEILRKAVRRALCERCKTTTRMEPSPPPLHRNVHGFVYAPHCAPVIFRYRPSGVVDEVPAPARDMLELCCHRSRGTSLPEQRRIGTTAPAARPKGRSREPAGGPVWGCWVDRQCRALRSDTSSRPSTESRSKMHSAGRQILRFPRDPSRRR